MIKPTIKSTLSEQINKLFDQKVERDVDEDSSDDGTRAKNFEYDLEEDVPPNPVKKIFHPKHFQLSDIRKETTRKLYEIDPKYKGIVSSRKDLQSESDTESEYEDLDKPGKSVLRSSLDKGDQGILSETEASSDNDLSKNSMESENVSDESDAESNESQSIQDDNSDASKEDDDFDDNFNILSTEPKDQDIHFKTRDRNKDIEKGACVQNQLMIWEKLLEIRIQSQKLLNKSNSLPFADKFNKFKSNAKFERIATDTNNNLTNLLFSLQTMQQLLVTNFPETKHLLKRKRITNSKDLPISGKLVKLEEDLQKDFDDYKPYRNQILEKFHDRTNITSKVKNSKKGLVNESFLSKINYNKHDQINRSQTVKGTYQLFGVNEKTFESDEKPHSSEIYDDTDFYHTQLRELIEFKTNTSGNSGEMLKQFAELQKLRNKMKKTVDTRASKGRKIRYAIHNKMVNFMAPNPSNSWTDESKNPLYSSIFGKTI